MTAPGDFDQASAAELAAGRLPLQAQYRLAAQRDGHTFGSNLSVAEHHAIRSVGFEPVGQVLGSCVYHVGWTGGYACGYRLGGQSAVVEAMGIRRSLYDARMLALSRMRQECAALGGDGVVAVRLQIGPFAGGGVEFQAVGTAIRAHGLVRPRVPFTSDLSGQDFAKLIGAGWVPVALVIGLSVLARHDDRQTQWQTASWTNSEVTGYTQLVHGARDHVRRQIAQECRQVRADGVVVGEMSLNVGERECASSRGEQRDHLAEAMLVGTAIASFARNGPQEIPLSILRLG